MGLGVLLGGAADSPSQAQTYVPPVAPAAERVDTLHSSTTVNGQVVPKQQEFGTFGCAAGAFKTGSYQGALTDAVIAATSETGTDAQSTDYSANGNAYRFEAKPLELLSQNPLLLVPGKYEAGQRVGNLGLASGRMLSAHEYETLYVSAYLRDVAGGATQVGAVDGYRIQGSLTPDVPIFGANAFVPRPLPPATQIEGSQSFGASIAVADLDGDGAKDLIVGAPSIGRVYVFWGDPSLPDGVHPTGSGVTILTAPNPLSWDGTSGAFGNHLAVGKVDPNPSTHLHLLVGQPKWGASASVPFSGRAFLYSGAVLALSKPQPGATAVYSGLFNDPIAFVPPAPLSGDTSDYNFGWYLWMMDLNGDGLDDLVIHPETSVWPGTSNGGLALGTSARATPIAAVGSLYFWLRQPAPAFPPFTTAPQHHLFSSAPSQGLRFGKNVVLTMWWNSDVGALRLALVVSEPERDYPVPGSNPPRTTDQAGIVALYFVSEILALGATPTSMAPSWETFNVGFMDFPSLSQTGPSTEDLFGRWMAAGSFGGGAGSKPQILVTASGHSVPDPQNPTQPFFEAGAAAHLQQRTP